MKIADPAIAGLILAAGESSRMGQDKASLTYRGKTFLETIIATLREAGIKQIVVVLGHHSEQIQQGSQLNGASVAVNQDYQLGQTSSLQTGLRALEETGTDGILLCLVDHPAISADSIKKLIHCFRVERKPIVVPTFNGERGHPVLIRRDLFGEISALGPHEGANTVIRKHRDRTQFVEVSDPGVLLDVDDLEAYQRLTEHK